MSCDLNESIVEDLVERLLSHTNLSCYDCGNHMIYDSDRFTYLCRFCYNTVEAQDAHPYDVIIMDWDAVKTIVELYGDPRELIEKFISEVLKQEVTEEKVEKIMVDLSLNSGYVLK